MQDDIKLAYMIAISIMMSFVAFIIVIVLMYNRRQLLYLKEKQLKESEYQNQLLQKELEKQKSIEIERERISHDMHDDLGARISALKLQAEFLKQKAEDEDLINDINDLLKTSEEMNISMREMLWSLNSGNDTVGSFIEYAKIYAEGFLKKTPIVLSFDRDQIVSDAPISTELRRSMFLCIKEALNNAYKYSGADQLKLSFIQENKYLIMNISDNGRGFKIETASGNGLRNMERRMKESCGTFEISSTEKGTSILFKISL
ncbi:histidine kinase [Chryseobacterium sp. 09-1422]|uniref:histidine kinase n=1 Tax=Chryseobacterium kimseyorum TaxID=2984028 RepID=A0ABT3HUF1_9FLAO|nr:histidine kinase [Chryseobacterium kimseyorum]MCW3167413.1 histidine kinase [Chryseobacterium kimseyorum]